jgi:hypothetical protein
MPDDASLFFERMSKTADLAGEARRSTEEVRATGPSVEVWQHALIQQRLDRPSAGRKRTPQERKAAYERFRAAFLELVADPFWSKHGANGAELRRGVDRLGALLVGDPQLRDPDWKIREALDEIDDLFATMYRRIERVALDNPSTAARFLSRVLERLAPDEFARIAGARPEELVRRADSTAAPSSDRPREVVVAQLVYDLRGSMSASGIAYWFNDARLELHNGRPLDLLAEDLRAAEPVLRSLARAGRGQLAT